MKISSKGLKDGYFLDIFGGNSPSVEQGDMPTYSIPFKIEDAPEDTVSFAAILYDVDAFAVTNGFPWIHWTIANLTKKEVKENESIDAVDFVQGVNSWHSQFVGGKEKKLTSMYGGMTPPDQDHVYTLTVFALDALLDIENGFMLNEWNHKIKEHILASATLEGKYRKLD
ncbi:YbhB/YbcL family Raf kinase inhibitor-like protein [Enterococcus sp. AZ192]|uniref:YbhB/YbcL family Raf kinase inhibitor-like protein n=1 Tax=unclassified Enterococcus TaxID=2608891 RepID=UPI003D2BB26D